MKKKSSRKMTSIIDVNWIAGNAARVFLRKFIRNSFLGYQVKFRGLLGMFYGDECGYDFSRDCFKVGDLPAGMTTEARVEGHAGDRNDQAKNSGNDRF